MNISSYTNPNPFSISNLSFCTCSNCCISRTLAALAPVANPPQTYGYNTGFQHCNDASLLPISHETPCTCSNCNNIRKLQISSLQSQSYTNSYSYAPQPSVEQPSLLLSDMPQSPFNIENYQDSINFEHQQQALTPSSSTPEMSPLQRDEDTPPRKQRSQGSRSRNKRKTSDKKYSKKINKHIITLAREFDDTIQEDHRFSGGQGPASKDGLLLKVLNGIRNLKNTVNNKDRELQEMVIYKDKELEDRIAEVLAKCQRENEQLKRKLNLLN